MKTISTAAVSLFVGLAILIEAHAQTGPGSSPQAKPPAPGTSDADVLLNMFTNVLEGLGNFGVHLHVESLTLNLNGYALVGLQNSLNSPDAEQVIIRSDDAGNTSVASGAVSGIEPKPGSSKTEDANGSRFTLTNTNVMSVVSNLLSAAKISGLGFHIGRVTLNLNGYAMVGVTNALDGLTARQRLTNSSATQATAPQAGSPDSQIRKGSSTAVRAHSGGDVTLDFNGTAALTLPLSVPKAQLPAPPSP